jgi:hypothetical protein
MTEQAIVERTELAVLKRLEDRALSYPAQAAVLAVFDAQSYLTAGDFLARIKELRREVDAHHQPIIDAAHRAHKAAVDAKRRLDSPLAQAEAIISQKRTVYRQEEMGRRLEEERRLQAEAKRKADEEARQRAEEAQIQAAIEAEDNGDAVAAREILAAPVIPGPVYVPLVILPKQAPKTEGLSLRKNWKFRISSPEKLPDEYWIPDEMKIGQVVRAMKDQANIPGVEVYCEESEGRTGRG